MANILKRPEFVLCNYHYRQLLELGPRRSTESDGRFLSSLRPYASNSSQFASDFSLSVQLGRDSSFCSDSSGKQAARTNGLFFLIKSSIKKKTQQNSIFNLLECYFSSKSSLMTVKQLSLNKSYHYQRWRGNISAFYGNI